jgi:hypothetical protein
MTGLVDRYRPFLYKTQSKIKKSWTGLLIWMNKNGFKKADKTPFEIYQTASLNNLYGKFRDSFLIYKNLMRH